MTHDEIRQRKNDTYGPIRPAIRVLRERGMTLQQICDWLHAHQFRTTTGSKFCQGHVSLLVRGLL